MATGETYAGYLRDLGYRLRERAEEATREERSIRAKRRVEERTVSDAFVEGRSQAFYEVISMMRNQAVAFEIPLVDLALEGLDPERDLL